MIRMYQLGDISKERTAFDEKERKEKAISSLDKILALMDMEEILDMKLRFDGCVGTIAKVAENVVMEEADRHNMDFAAAYFNKMSEQLDIYLKHLKDGGK